MKYQKPKIELLFIHNKDGYIALDPFRGVAFKLNKNAYLKFQQVLNGNKSNCRIEDSEFILSRLNELKKIPVLASTNSSFYAFSQLVLLLTHDCNMRCAYCYSFGGRKNSQMTTKAAQSAVDFVINNVVKNNLKRFNISFHGGGEPTLAWQNLKNIYFYAKERCEKFGIDFRSRLTSNGLWTNNQAQWIASKIDSVLISLDGPEDIMRLHRPTLNNKPSLPSIIRSINILRENGHVIRIRATVSDRTVKRLSELVEFFTSLGATFTQLEPLTDVGRTVENNIKRPQASEFISHFLDALKLGKEMKCKVTCSYLRPIRYSQGFCGALGRVFILSPEGNISTCHRIDSEDDVGANGLLVGNIDLKTGEINIDMEKFESLSNSRLQKPKECNQCIAKYSCSGGCYAQNASISGNIWKPDPYRCLITKSLTKSFLEESLNHSTFINIGSVKISMKK